MAVATRPSTDDRIRAALSLAQMGFGIFPVWSTTPTGMCRCPAGPACTSPGKHPITQKGFHDATQDAERIRILLSAGSEPNYGLVNPDGVFTLDVDGDGWIERWAELNATLGELPPTLIVETAHGLHVYLRWPDDVGPRPLGELFGFVTRWGSGRGAGYVLGPLSVHASGAVYRRLADAPVTIATLPEKWAQRALHGGTGAPPAGTDAGGASFTIAPGRYTLPDAVAEGGRYEAIVHYTAHLYNRGFTDGEMWAAVQHELAPRFAKPLSLPELRARFERAVADMPARLGERRNLPGQEPSAPPQPDGNETGFLPLDDSGTFPPDPDEAAFGGLLGECVDDITDGTDASRVGLLGSLIALLGALVPVQAYFHRVQTSSPFIALVGESSIGRKGTAMNRAKDALSFGALDVSHVNRAVLDGLNSGEGLVSALHYKQTTYKDEPTAAVVFEEEYASLIQSASRDGATLDPKMRLAFDGGPLSNRRSKDSQSVEPPYWLPALIGITPSELRLVTGAGSLRNGSGNRWLYLPVQRRPVLVQTSRPEFAPEHGQALADARRWALARRQSLAVDPEAVRALGDYMDALPALATGLTAGMALELTKRYSVIAFRIALVHAGVEQSTVVTAEHVARGMALTEYARQGIGWVFGNVMGSPDAALLLRHLTQHGTLRYRTVQREILTGRGSAQAAADELLRLGLARVETVQLSPRGGQRARVLVLQTRPPEPSMQGGVVAVVPPARARGTQPTPPLSQPPGHAQAVHDTTPDITLHNPRTTPHNPAQPTDGVSYVGRRPDGSVWCWYWREHTHSHRDVAGGDPWCPICSPKEGAE